MLNLLPPIFKVYFLEICQESSILLWLLWSEDFFSVVFQVLLSNRFRWKHFPHSAGPTWDVKCYRGLLVCFFFPLFVKWSLDFMGWVILGIAVLRKHFDFICKQNFATMTAPCIHRGFHAWRSFVQSLRQITHDKFNAQPLRIQWPSFQCKVGSYDHEFFVSNWLRKLTNTS